jgi:hypothetical protein
LQKKSYEKRKSVMTHKAVNLKNNIPQPFVEGQESWTDLSAFCWQSAYSHVCHNPNLPSPDYVDNVFSQTTVWTWDSCYISLYCKYASDNFPGMQTLDNFYAWQRDDGYISMAYTLATGEDRYCERVNPPLFAWAEWDYYRCSGDSSRIVRVLPHLNRLFDWLVANRKCQDLDLYWFEDGGSSGMDNSPRGHRAPEAGRHLGWVDLSSQLAMAALYISRLAEVVGQAHVASRFQAEWQKLGAAVERWCWCPRSQFYHDRQDGATWLSSKTAAGFWPLLAEFAPAEHVQALCEHLENPQTFGRPFPVPTLSYDDPNYVDDGRYWHGGVWAPTNYMIISGLRKHGRHDLARKLACKYLDQMAEVYRDFSEHPGTVWEAYSPEKALPALNGETPQEWVKPDFTGWSAIGPTALFYEAILGLEIDVPERTLTWRLGLEERHGVTQFPFGQGRVDLVAEANAGLRNPPSVTVRSNVDFTLILEQNGKDHRYAIKKGQDIKVEEMKLIQLVRLGQC